MKFILTILSTASVCMISNSVFSQDRADTLHLKNNKANFEYHLRNLDSAAKTSISDTIICCFNSIYFMERNTKIEGEGPATYFGKLFFTKKALMKWHQWFNKNYQATGG